MPESKKYSAVFAGCALAVLGAWTTLIVGVAALSSGQSDATRSHDVSARATGGMGQTHQGQSYQGLAGPLANHLKRRFAQHPTFTHLRLSHSTGRGLFAGRGAPNHRVVLLKGQRTLADTRTNANGEWQISAAIVEIAGTHAFSLEQRMDEGQYVAGESLRLHVPKNYQETVDVTNHGAAAGFQLVAVRADGEDIGSAASRKFDELLRDGSLDGNTDKTPDKPRRIAQRGGDILEPAWSWLEDANRSYHGEVVPRIKRGGGSQSVAVSSNRRDREEVVTPVRRWRGEGDSGWPTVGSWAPLGIGEWMTAARRGYSTEIVPRLSGKVPSVIIARRPDEVDERETDAQRQRRLERERNATDEAERQRLAAERRRRAEEQRRVDEEKRRVADKQEAERAAEQRRRDDEEEARKIAEERRRVLERRAEQQRLAALGNRDKEVELEAERRRAREAELTRAQEEAEKAALERQRRAELENQQRDESEARRSKAEAFEQERRRLAQLRLQEREKAREETERRRLATQRRDRLTAEAEAIKRRRAQATLRAREDEQQRLERQREERRQEQRVAAAERERERERAQEETRRLEEQRRRVALAAERAQQEANAVPKPTQRPRRFAQSTSRDRNRFRVRDTEIEFRNSDRTTERTNRSSQTEDQPRRTTQRRFQDLNSFRVRDTEIEISRSDRSTTKSTPSTKRTELPRQQAKQAQKPRRVAALRTAQLRRKAKARRRKSKVRGYRRRLASKSKSRCGRRAGRRVDPPGTYVVRKGDSLWRISKRHYRLGRYFRTIHRANARKIRKARLIYPCQRFHLPRRK
ncbi:MAG: colicin import membrane protein [Hyphomicrobiaceae bacterium]|jgi:colicin import membrane protein